MYNLTARRAAILARIQSMRAEKAALSGALEERTRALSEAMADFRGITALLAGVWSLLPGNIRARLEKYREVA